MTNKKEKRSPPRRRNELRRGGDQIIKIGSRACDDTNMSEQKTKNRSAARFKAAAAASSEVSVRAKTLASKFWSIRCRYVPPAAAPPWVPAPPEGPAVEPVPPVAPVPPTAPMPPAVEPAPPVVPVAPVALAE